MMCCSEIHKSDGFLGRPCYPRYLLCVMLTVTSVFVVPSSLSSSRYKCNWRVCQELQQVVVRDVA